FIPISAGEIPIRPDVTGMATPQELAIHRQTIRLPAVWLRSMTTSSFRWHRRRTLPGSSLSHQRQQTLTPDFYHLRPHFAVQNLSNGAPGNSHGSGVAAANGRYDSPQIGNQPMANL